MLTATKSGSLTVVQQEVRVEGTNAESFSVQLTGTFVGTMSFEISLDGGTTWVAFGMTPSTDLRAGVIVATATAPGVWLSPVQHAAIPHFRARCSAFTSGTIVVTVAAGV
jgi:hypothetical protein